jgi:hypothetical protein
VTKSTTRQTVAECIASISAIDDAQKVVNRTLELEIDQYEVNRSTLEHAASELEASEAALTLIELLTTGAIEEERGPESVAAVYVMTAFDVCIDERRLRPGRADPWEVKSVTIRVSNRGPVIRGSFSASDGALVSLRVSTALRSGDTPTNVWSITLANYLEHLISE